MHLTSLEYCVWMATFAAKILLAAVMLWRGSWRRWPFLFIAALFEIALTSVLFPLRSHEHRHAYFNIYWDGAIVRSLVRLAILFDVVRSIPRIQYAPRSIATFLLTVSVTVTVGAVYLAAGADHGHLPILVHFVLMLDRCVAVLWVTFALALFFSLDALGIGWSGTGLRVASGYLVTCGGAMLVAFAETHWPAYSRGFDGILTCLTIGVYLFWAVTLCREDQPATLHLTPPQQALLLRLLGRHFASS